MLVFPLNHFILQFLVITKSVIRDAAIELRAICMNEAYGSDMWRVKELEKFICNLFLNWEESEKPLPHLLTVYLQIHKQAGGAEVNTNM